MKRQYPDLYFKILFFFVLAILGGTSAATPLSKERLLIVRSGEAPVYLSVETRFRAYISQNVENLIHVKSVNLNNSARLKQIFSDKLSKSYDYIISVGTKAAYEVLRRDPDVPVLSVFIPRQTYLAIINEFADEGQLSKRSAIYIDQPDERLVLLAKTIAGEKARVSLFAIPNRSGLVKTRQCSSRGLSTLMTNVNVHQELLSSNYLKRVLKRSDVIIATAKLLKDSPSAIKWVLYMAYERNMPVIAYSKAIVEAGALAAVYSTAEDIGKHAAEVFLSHAANTHKKMPVPMYPKYFQVSVNQNVAQVLGYFDLNSSVLREKLLEFSLSCQDNYFPPPVNKHKQQITRR